MLRRALYLLSTIMLAAPLHAQWEQLPLWGGHADLLVQNKYKKNEIFAVIARGGLYRSTDHGNTWTTVLAHLASLGNGTRNCGQLFNDDLATDFEVTQGDVYYLYAAFALWRSEDQGATWVHDTTFGRSFLRYAVLETNEDGTLFFNPGRQEDDTLYISRDDGRTWKALPYSCISCQEALYSTPYDARTIILYGGHQSLKTTNFGKTWQSVYLPDSRTLYYGMNTISHDREICLHLWGDSYIVEGPHEEFNYYESDDSGSTWHRRNDSTLVFNRDRTFHECHALLTQDSTALMTTYQILFQSNDQGRTFHRVDSIHPQDMLALDSTVLATCTNQGFMESTDNGATWRQIMKPHQIPGYRQVQFRCAGNPMMYAIVSDGDNSGYAQSTLMQSTDRGDSWTEVLRAQSLHSLRVSASPQPRYYVVADDHAILTGTLGQSAPDTLLTNAKTISDLETTDAFPGDLYAVLRGGWEFRYSTDYGRTWTTHSVPGYPFSGFWLVPSRKTQGLAVAVTLPVTEDMVDGMGLWKVVVPSDDWYYTYKRNDLGQPNYSMLDGDVFYNAYDRTFSTDYGWTWHENVTGIDTTDIVSISRWGSRYFAPHGDLIMADCERWYRFRQDRWERIRDPVGRPLSGPPPAVLDIAGPSLYAGYPYSGLFRSWIDLGTDAGRPIGPAAATLACYPNPARHAAQIAFTLPDDGPALLEIVDAAGRQIYCEEVRGRQGFIPWPTDDAGGGQPHSGFFIVHLIDDDLPIATTHLIIQ